MLVSAHTTLISFGNFRGQYQRSWQVRRQGKPSIDAAVRLSRRCESVAFDWLLEDIGWQPAADEQGALLRHHAERVPLACVIQHAHGGLTGWYLRPRYRRSF